MSTTHGENKATRAIQQYLMQLSKPIAFLFHFSCTQFFELRGDDPYSVYNLQYKDFVDLKGPPKELRICQDRDDQGVVIFVVVCSKMTELRVSKENNKLTSKQVICMQLQNNKGFFSSPY